MFVHGTRSGIDTGADDTAEDDVTRHGGTAAATDFGLHDDRTALVARLAHEYRQGITTTDLEARGRASDLAGRQTHLGVLRHRIDDKDFLGSAGNGGAAGAKKNGRECEK